METKFKAINHLQIEWFVENQWRTPHRIILLETGEITEAGFFTPLDVLFAKPWVIGGESVKSLQYSITEELYESLPEDFKLLANVD